MENLAQVPQEYSVQRIGKEEAELSKALRAYKIKSSSIEELKSALKYAMFKVGLRSQNFPEDEDQSLLISHIISNYGNHTVDEIRLAFDMAITGKFTIEKNETIVCYENFSCQYFSFIMNLYRKWAAEQVRFNEQQHKLVNELPAPKISDDEIIDNALSVWKCTGRYEFISESSYECLVKSGKINLSTAEKKVLMNAVNITLEEMQSRDANVFHGGKRKDFQILFSKKMAVRNYFQSISNE